MKLTEVKKLIKHYIENINESELFGGGGCACDCGAAAQQSCIGYAYNRNDAIQCDCSCCIELLNFPTKDPKRKY
tara:strand:- start:83 stop:304 length:222 start_codon:yes stop_codon:yes gene_type:complete